MASTIDTKRRVKHYVLNESRQWVDQGTGHVWWHFNKRTVSLVVKSEADGSILLESKILPNITYQRQQETLIVWSDQNRRDLALSFQEKSGCDEIWEKICEVLGEDTSIDGQSPRSTGGGAANNNSGASGEGGGGNGGASSSRSLESNNNLDEDGVEKEDDADPNLSPADDLPPCELVRLKDIRDYFTCFLPRHSKRYKERLAACLESDSYIQRLIDLFHTCEDLENDDGLHYLYEIFRCLFYLNKSSLLDILLADDIIMDVIGCLEYDPNKPEPTRHREFITSKARFKEIIAFENSELVAKIQQTYKVQYIQDVILPAPSVFENSLTSLSSYVFLNKVEISNLIQDDERFLTELFENLKTLAEGKNERNVEMLEFLREYTSFLHGLQQAREPFFKSLYDHGLLDVIELALGVHNDERVNQIAVDMLGHFVEVSPTLVREFILNEIETKSSVNNLNMSLSRGGGGPSRSQLAAASSNSSSNSSSSNNSSNATTTITISNSNNNNNHHNHHHHHHQQHSKYPLSLVASSTAATGGGNLLTVVNPLVGNTNNDYSATTTTGNQDEEQASAMIDTTSAIVNNNLNHSVAMLSLSDILNTDDVFEPVLINYAIRQMINDPDPELGGALQIVNFLKLLIDPENMLSVANKSDKAEFLAYFYRKSMCVLVAPLRTNTSGGRIHREDFLIAQLQNLILDFLSFCVEHHTFHIKNYIVHKDLLKQILVLLKSKHQFLALSALRFLRKTISLKEETYNKYIIKSNLFEPLIEALKNNASRYNILNSAIIELFDFIRSEDIKSLMNYVVESFYPFLDSITYVKTFQDLKLRYEQHKDRYSDQYGRSRYENEETPGLYRSRGMMSDRYRLVSSDRIDYDKNDEDAWIEEDDDDDGNNMNNSENHRAYLLGSSSNNNNANNSTSSGIGRDEMNNSSENESTSTMRESCVYSSSLSNDGFSMQQQQQQQHSSTNGPTSFADMHMSAEFVEFKRRHSQMSGNGDEDDNNNEGNNNNHDDDEDADEAALFSPIRHSQLSGGGHHHSNKHSTISIKINTTSLKNIMVPSSSATRAAEDTDSVAQTSTSLLAANNNDSSSTRSSLSPGSNPSTPTHSPLCAKKALVDYEDDSDEEEAENEEQTASEPTIMPTKAISSSAPSTTTTIEVTSSTKQETGNEESPSSSSSSPSLCNKPNKTVETQKTIVDEESMFKPTVDDKQQEPTETTTNESCEDNQASGDREQARDFERNEKVMIQKNNDEEVDDNEEEDRDEDELRAELNGQTEPANKRARLSST